MDSESPFDSPSRPAQTPIDTISASNQHTSHNHHHQLQYTDLEYQSPGTIDTPRGDIASALFPLQPSSETESDLESQVRDFHARDRNFASHRFTRLRARFRAQQLEHATNLGLAALFSEAARDDESSSSSQGSSDESSEEPAASPRFGPEAGYSSDWDSLELPEGQPEAPRSFLGQSLLNIRTEARRLLLLAVLQIKIESPGISAEVAWRSLTNWLVRDRVIVRDNEVVTLWMFAFNEPAGAHFRSVFESSVESVRAMWNEEYS